MEAFNNCGKHEKCAYSVAAGRRQVQGKGIMDQMADNQATFSASGVAR